MAVFGDESSSGMFFARSLTASMMVSAAIGNTTVIASLTLCVTKLLGKKLRKIQSLK